MQMYIKQLQKMNRTRSLLDPGNEYLLSINALVSLELLQIMEKRDIPFSANILNKTYFRCCNFNSEKPSVFGSVKYSLLLLLSL